MLAIDDVVSVLRGVLDEVSGIFRDSEGHLRAQQGLGKLRRRPQVQPNTAYAKALNFLVNRLDDMITFLGSAGVQRNSLAESGIRCPRRLGQGHDGFRGPVGRDNYLRPYRAIPYCGWSVHRGDSLLFLPPQQTTSSAIAAWRSPRRQGRAPSASGRAALTALLRHLRGHPLHWRSPAGVVPRLISQPPAGHVGHARIIRAN